MELLEEHEEISSLTCNQGLRIFMEVLLSPFDDPSFQGGRADLIWYEKYSLLRMFHLIHNLKTNNMSYSVPSRRFSIPSKIMVDNLDQEFCRRLIESIQSDRTLFIDIVADMTPQVSAVNFMVSNRYSSTAFSEDTSSPSSSSLRILYLSSPPRVYFAQDFEHLQHRILSYGPEIRAKFLRSAPPEFIYFKEALNPVFFRKILHLHAILH